MLGHRGETKQGNTDRADRRSAYVRSSRAQCDPAGELFPGAVRDLNGKTLEPLEGRSKGSIGVRVVIRFVGRVIEIDPSRRNRGSIAGSAVPLGVHVGGSVENDDDDDDVVVVRAPT